MHMKDTVDLGEWSGLVDVSTLNVPNSGWETCLFFGNGGSMVVAYYADGVQAQKGHQAFTHRAVLAQITDMYAQLEERH